MNIKFGSLCSGIEAASVAWQKLGWKPAWFSEIDNFPCQLLKYHYPEVPNHGNMLDISKKILNFEIEAPDILIGGTPCQSFSFAGLRKGLDDQRGNLSLTYVEVLNVIDSVRINSGLSESIFVWENVPGVLSSKDNAFGCFLGALSGESIALQSSGRKWPDAGCVIGPKRTIAWRVLDAQYFGSAQRRRRLFVIGSARKGFNPFEILFEFEGLRNDSRESKKEKPTHPRRIENSFGESNLKKVYMIHGENSGAMQGNGKAAVGIETEISRCLDTCGGYSTNQGGNVVLENKRVRKFTPIECELLQRFPKNYTKIPWKVNSETPDNLRYKAIGNSMCVSVIYWIGERLKFYLDK